MHKQRPNGAMHPKKQLCKRPHPLTSTNNVQFQRSTSFNQCSLAKVRSDSRVRLRARDQQTSFGFLRPGCVSTRSKCKPAATSEATGTYFCQLLLRFDPGAPSVLECKKAAINRNIIPEWQETMLGINLHLRSLQNER